MIQHPPEGFQAVDFHIHTRLSRCYVDHVQPERHFQTTPDAILDAAMNARLDAIAVTDHNGAESVDALRQIARGSDIVVFPGAEISARGGHCLAIFDPATDVDVIRSLLLALGLGSEQWGDGFARTPCWIDEVFGEIARRGGLAIAAHVDRGPNGFLASDERPSDKQRIYQHADLGALEITDSGRRERYATGADPRYRRPRPCIQGSDAHAPDEVGRRPTWLRLDEPNLAGVRHALAHFQQSILFPGDSSRQTGGLEVSPNNTSPPGVGEGQPQAGQPKG